MLIVSLSPPLNTAWSTPGFKLAHTSLQVAENCRSFPCIRTIILFLGQLLFQQILVHSLHIIMATQWSQVLRYPINPLPSLHHSPLVTAKVVMTTTIFLMTTWTRVMKTASKLRRMCCVRSPWLPSNPIWVVCTLTPGYLLTRSLRRLCGCWRTKKFTSTSRALGEYGYRILKSVGPWVCNSRSLEYIMLTDRL